MWYQNIRSALGLFGFVTKHACDRRADRRTELLFQRPRYSIAASRDKNQIVHSLDEKTYMHLGTYIM